MPPLPSFWIHVGDVPSSGSQYITACFKSLEFSTWTKVWTCMDRPRHDYSETTRVDYNYSRRVYKETTPGIPSTRPHDLILFSINQMIPTHLQPLWKMVDSPVTEERVYVHTNSMSGLHNRTYIVILGDRHNLFRHARVERLYSVRRQLSSLLRPPFSVFFVFCFNFWFWFFYSVGVRGRDRWRAKTRV